MEPRFIEVRGTHGAPFRFGGAAGIDLTIDDFWIATTTLALPNGLPRVELSWDDAIAELARLGASPLRDALVAHTGFIDGLLRLPSETEWEYAARGGPHWRDGFRYSGNDDIDAVAWYDRRHGDFTMPVARKAPNQLGVYDLSGNVWEWCADVYSDDVAAIPRDGSAARGDGDERVLRGGCFHNWAEHCTVSKRYAIGRQSHDGCIGVRPVFSAPR